MDTSNYETNSLLENFNEKMVDNPELIIRRPVFQQEELDCISDYSKPTKSFGERIGAKCKNFKIKSCMKKTIPASDWLLNYNWKENIFGDTIAGFTVAVMHIPQGMAYAILGNVSAVVGIYMAFFPVLVYMIFGTSRHNSMGTFAVISMMTGKVVLAHNRSIETINNSTQSLMDPYIEYTPIQVATAVTFCVALIELAMYVLRLGLISSLLSETLVSGFTTGAAVHVFSSQIKDLLGLRISGRRGILKVVYTCSDVFGSLDDINVTAAVISGITIVVIIFNNEVLKPRIAKLCAFPIPIEMIVVVIGTVLSAQLDFAGAYNIVTVGHIPVGLPKPTMPPVSLFPSVLLDSFIITMVAYSISMSMALIFAQKLNYEIDSNQELMAQGLGNLVGSFFSCMPFTASLSRSLVQTSVGGKTQLASLISCFLLLFVLFWIGPFMEPLPRCILASIIVVALKGMFLQILDLVKFCRMSFSDALLWLITFLSVVILDIEYGLLIGGVLCIVKLMIMTVKPYTCKLALIPNTELYLDMKRYHKTVQIPGIQIFHYCGGLNFATRFYFKNKVINATGVKPQEELSRRTNIYRTESVSKELKNLRVLILDFSALTHIDPAGVAILRGLISDYMKIGVSVYLTGCSGPVLEVMRKCNAIENTEDIFMMMPTVADAVRYARHEDFKLSISVPSSHL